MKRVFFALMVLLVSFSVNAIEWNAPESIPVGVNWSVYADFGSAGYDRIQVLLDGERVYETSWGSEYLDYERVLSARYYFTERELSISFAGLEEGMHSIEIRTLKEGSQTDSVSREIEVFVPGSWETVKQTKENFLSMRNSFDKLKDQIDSGLEGVDSINASLEKLQSDISALEGSLSSESKDIESLKASLNLLKQDFSGLSRALSTFSEQTAEKDENVSASLAGIEESIKQIEEEIEEATEPVPVLTGFFSFVQGNPLLALGLIVVIIVLVLFLLLRKKRASGMLFETGSTESGVSEEERIESEETEEEEKKKGKWAFGRGEEESKGFGFTDLLWKKK